MQSDSNTLRQPSGSQSSSIISNTPNCSQCPPHVLVANGSVSHAGAPLASHPQFSQHAYLDAPALQQPLDYHYSSQSCPRNDQMSLIRCTRSMKRECLHGPVVLCECHSSTFALKFCIIDFKQLEHRGISKPSWTCCPLVLSLQVLLTESKGPLFLSHSSAFRPLLKLLGHLTKQIIAT